MNRTCGDCQLCCKLTPVKEIAKPANTRCRHQRTGKGCMIYPNRPFSCMWWDCMWLKGLDPELRRPDHCHFVVDPELDFVTALDNLTGQRRPVPVIQIWGDTGYPTAYRDASLRDWLTRMHAEKGLYAVVRFANTRGVFLGPPLTPGGPLQEQETDWQEHEHSYGEKLAALQGGMIDG